jgi:hypothetical protein
MITNKFLSMYFSDRERKRLRARIDLERREAKTRSDHLRIKKQNTNKRS